MEITLTDLIKELEQLNARITVPNERECEREWFNDYLLKGEIHFEVWEVDFHVMEKLLEPYSNAGIYFGESGNLEERASLEICIMFGKSEETSYVSNRDYEFCGYPED